MINSIHCILVGPINYVIFLLLLLLLLLSAGLAAPLEQLALSVVIFYMMMLGFNKLAYGCTMLSDF